MSYKLSSSAQNKIRIFEPGKIYHIYNRGNRRDPIFFDEQDYEFYLARLKKYSEEAAIKVLCLCTMENHTHLCLKQGEKGNIINLVHRLHTSYTMYFNKKYSMVGHVFQGRFKYKHVSTLGYLIYLSFYIHANPWSANICAAEDYRYSSLHQFVPEDSWIKNSQPQICDASVILEHFGGEPAAYKKAFDLFKADRKVYVDMEFVDEDFMF